MEMIPKTKPARPRSPTSEQQGEQKRPKGGSDIRATHTLSSYASTREQAASDAENEEPQKDSKAEGETKVVQGPEAVRFAFLGMEIKPTDEDAFTDAVAQLTQFPRAERYLAALHEALKEHEQEEGQFQDALQYVEYVLQNDVGIPMHAPPQLGVSHFQELFESLWEATVSSQVEQGGIVTQEPEKQEMDFRAGNAGTGSHFTANTQDWNRKTEHLKAVVHTHPQGTSFSPSDLEGHLSVGAHVEYVRTEKQIFALMRTGDFENRFRQLAQEFGGGEKVVEDMRRQFEENYNKASDALIEQKLQEHGDQPLEGEARKTFLAECDQLATREAVKAYANWIHAGYYEGGSDEPFLLKKSDH